MFNTIRGLNYVNYTKIFFPFLSCKYPADLLQCGKKSILYVRTIDKKVIFFGKSNNIFRLQLSGIHNIPVSHVLFVHFI